MGGLLLLITFFDHVYLIAIVARIILNIYFAILVSKTKFRCQSVGRDDIWIGSYGVQRIHSESTLNEVQSEIFRI